MKAYAVTCVILSLSVAESPLSVFCCRTWEAAARSVLISVDPQSHPKRGVAWFTWMAPTRRRLRTALAMRSDRSACNDGGHGQCRGSPQPADLRSGAGRSIAWLARGHGAPLDRRI